MEVEFNNGVLKGEISEQGYKSFNNELPPSNTKIYVIWANGMKGGNRF